MNGRGSGVIACRLIKLQCRPAAILEDLRVKNAGVMPISPGADLKVVIVIAPKRLSAEGQEHKEKDLFHKPNFQGIQERHYIVSPSPHNKTGRASSMDVFRPPREFERFEVPV